MTQLHFASYFSQTDIVKDLVSKGASKNPKSKYGPTPYDVAKNDEIKNISYENGNNEQLKKQRMNSFGKTKYQ